MPLNSPSAPIGQWTANGIRMKFFFHRFDRLKEVGADAVHFVDERDARNAILVSLAPYCFGLRFYAGNGAEHGDSAIENAQRTLHFDGEVDVARGVDDVDFAMPFQKTVVAAEVIVMPRSCSCSIQSMVAAPSCTSPMRCKRPE